MAVDGVINVTFCILDPHVISFRHDPLVGIGIFYLAIKSQMLNRCRAVKWLMVVQQAILKIDNYTVFKYILVISEYQSANFESAVLFNLCTESMSVVGISKIFSPISEWDEFDTAAHSTDMSFSQTMFLLCYRVEKWHILTMLEVYKMGSPSISLLIGSR